MGIADITNHCPYRSAFQRIKSNGSDASCVIIVTNCDVSWATTPNATRDRARFIGFMSFNARL